jgi:MFS family permease
MVANFSLFGSIGQMTGPIVCTPVYEHFGFQAVCVLNTAMLLVALTVGFLVKKETWEGSAPLPPEHGGETEIKRSVWSLLSERNLRNAIITSGLVLSNRELFSAYFPLLAAQLGISPSMIGVLLAINGFTMLLVRFGQSALVRLFGRMNVLTWSLYISGLIYLVMPLSPWLIVMAVLVGILGAGLGLGQPLSMAYAIEVSPPDRKGEVLGLRITLNRSSQVSIPLIFGGLGGLAGASAVFLASGAVLALFGYLTRPLPSDRQKAEKKGMGM